MNEKQIERTAKEWSEIAQEPVTIEPSKGAVYAKGSELACLRLEHKFNCAHGRAKHSENLKSWVFGLETRF